MKSVLISFVAVYGILFQGIFFLLFLLSQESLRERVHLFIVFGIMVTIVVALSKLLKLFFRVARPKGKALFVPADSYSFPSSHASGLVTVCALFYPLSQIFFLISLFITMCTLYGRVKSRVHTYKDMLGGATLAIILCFLLEETITLFSDVIVKALL